jgi:muramoyltetrapeptide carboxypeptidase
VPKRPATHTVPVRPPRLSRGDRVRVISLSGTFPKASWQTATWFGEPLGLKVEIGRSMSKDPGYLGRDPRRRADDFNEAVRDERVRGIFLFRGGNSAAETLPYLDFDALKKNPKVIAGFSDHSSILLAAHRCANLVTFLAPPFLSAPSAGKNSKNLTLDSFRRLVMEGEAWVAMPDLGGKTWRKGTARGRLIGGNFAVLRQLLGTPYAAELDGSILVWEEIGESIENINAMLTHLTNARVLDGVRGMVVGHLEGIPPKENGFTVEEFALEKFAKGPVLKTKAFGHFRPCFTLPLGVMAALDAGARSLVLEESAVD